MLCIAVISGCRSGENEAAQGLSFRLSVSGPMDIVGEAVDFPDICDRLKELGAKTNTRIEVVITPDVPQSRRNALAVRMRKAEFHRVVFTMSITGMRGVEHRQAY